MGLTKNSTGTKILNETMESLKEKCNYTISLAREPECRKKHCF